MEEQRNDKKISYGKICEDYVIRLLYAMMVENY